MTKRIGLCLLLPFFLFFTFLAVNSALATADPSKVCLMEGYGERSAEMPDCPKETSPLGADKANIASAAWGLRLNPNIAGIQTKTPIDAHHICRFLDSTASESYFVPFRTAPEWSGFVAAPLTGITKTTCARPFVGQNMDKNLFFGPTTARPDLGDTGGQYADVDLPYWRSGEVWPPAGYTVKHTFNLTCTRPANCATYSWQEVFKFEATAGVSADSANPAISWKDGKSTRVSGPSTRPAICNQSCCTPSKCKVCKNGVKVNAKNGTACGSGGWCNNGSCEAFFWDVCSGKAGYVRCWKSPTNGSRSGYKTDRPCSWCPAGKTSGGDECAVCPNVWGSGRSGEWSHKRYF